MGTSNFLFDDYGDTCKETRVLPYPNGNIICGRKGYFREISWRKDRNKELAKEAQYSLPLWEDLRVYDKIEE